MPRDREGSFTPRLVPKGVARLGGLDEMIISLYAGGMTVRDIGHHLARTLGTELSHETITKITDAVAEEVLAWQRRPLEALYPVIYLDAIVVKVRDGGARAATRPPTSRSGSTWTASSTCSGSGSRPAEGAKFWAGVCAELANRGVRDVLIVCCDGLTGLPEAIEATWPQATVQTCVVHLIRASMRFVSYGDRKAVAAALQADLHRRQRRGRPRPSSRRFADSNWGTQVPARGRDLGTRPGSGSPRSWRSRRAAPGHLHHQHDRVAELPAAQDHQEPRPLPQRRRRGQAALAGDLQHRGQTSPRTREGTRPSPPTNARPQAASSKAKSSPTGSRPWPSSPSSTPTASTPTCDRMAYTEKLTGSYKTRQVAEATRSLPYEAARWVDEELAARVNGFGIPTIERLVALAAARFAPEEQAEKENGRPVAVARHPQPPATGRVRGHVLAGGRRRHRRPDRVPPARLRRRQAARPTGRHRRLRGPQGQGPRHHRRPAAHPRPRRGPAQPGGDPPSGADPSLRARVPGRPRHPPGRRPGASARSRSSAPPPSTSSGHGWATPRPPSSRCST